ncbi:uncharacterized protein LOC119739666 isoform X2 [Patiria miniata]|uniref:Phosphatidylethanolamine-binding protein n=1 Tax=Patiria miniata TaxID=46514 RepID=A0A914B3K2_PATMI|nr:uncharacterized protein LOC119739666 isoform X2 [Patiria miniata]
MARFLLLVASAFIVNTATAGLIPESSNPCQLGGLQVTYRDERYPCGETVSLDVFSNGKPPGDVTLDADVTEDNKYYTLVMVDPDAPASRGQAYWLHWLVINIKTTRPRVPQGAQPIATSSSSLSNRESSAIPRLRLLIAEGVLTLEHSSLSTIWMAQLQDIKFLPKTSKEKMHPSCCNQQGVRM